MRNPQRKSSQRKHSNDAADSMACVFHTPLGWIGILGSRRGISLITCPQARRHRAEALVGLPETRGTRKAAAAHRALRDLLQKTEAQLTAYCKGRRRVFDFPLDLGRATAFQQRVWQKTLKIPYGFSSSYQKLALSLGNRRLSRAVGNALGANPLPLVIPCHRVLTSGGDLGGYAGGLNVKKALLDLEGAGPRDRA